ncbi:MAG: adenylyl-sulfate kinase [Actinomycetota bacterium]
MKSIVVEHGVNFLKQDFFEIFVNTPLEICKERDPKGHYKRANKGEISDFTGVSHPYEVPTKPDLAISGVGEISKNRKLILELL